MDDVLDLPFIVKSFVLWLDGEENFSRGCSSAGWHPLVVGYADLRLRDSSWYRDEFVLKC